MRFKLKLTITRPRCTFTDTLRRVPAVRSETCVNMMHINDKSWNGGECGVRCSRSLQKSRTRRDFTTSSGGAVCRIIRRRLQRRVGEPSTTCRRERSTPKPTRWPSPASPSTGRTKWSCWPLTRWARRRRGLDPLSDTPPRLVRHTAIRRNYSALMCAKNLINYPEDGIDLSRQFDAGHSVGIPRLAISTQRVLSSTSNPLL